MKTRKCWNRDPQSISLMENQLKLSQLFQEENVKWQPLSSNVMFVSLSVCTSLMSRPAVYPLLKTSDYARICNFEV